METKQSPRVDMKAAFDRMTFDELVNLWLDLNTGAAKAISRAVAVDRAQKSLARRVRRLEGLREIARVTKPEHVGRMSREERRGRIAFEAAVSNVEHAAKTRAPGETVDRLLTAAEPHAHAALAAKRARDAAPPPETRWDLVGPDGVAFLRADR